MMSENYRLVRLIPVGNGSRRVTLPKEMLDEIVGKSEYMAVSKDKGSLRLTPVEVKPIEIKTKVK
jgi:hypothetical protein